MEKTVTFTVTDALLSPMALSVLSGAAIDNAGEDNEGEVHVKHIHVSLDSLIKKADSKFIAEVSYAKLSAELGIDDTQIEICDDAKVIPYAAVLDHNGSIVDWATKAVLSATAKNAVKDGADAVFELTGVDAYEGYAVKLDFYVILKDKASQITIAPDSFGGYFYVEADTLFRDQDGRDLAATLTFPKVKIQSNFTISMAPNGDPQTYDFVMDAMPAYTYFDNTKKVVCDMVIIGAGTEKTETVSHKKDHTAAEG